MCESIGHWLLRGRCLAPPSTSSKSYLDHLTLLRHISESSLPDCLIGLFLHLSLYTLWITFHAIQTGWRTKSKDFVQALHGHWRNQRLLVNKDLSVFSACCEICLIKRMHISTVKRYISLRQKFNGLVINLAKKTLYKMDFSPRVLWYEKIMWRTKKGNFNVYPVKFSGFSILANACSCLLMLTHACSLALFY